jgi:omega-amidase
MLLKIALFQSKILLGQPEANLQKVITHAQTAASAGCDLLILPELCLHGYDRKSIQDQSEFHLPLVFPTLAEIAIKNRILISGTFVEIENATLFNTQVMIDSKGQLLKSYRKTHLFKKLNEDRFFSSGNQVQVVDTTWGKVGLAICYDLRFPEMFRAMMRQGVEGYIICAEWPLARINHWKTLLQARAIENQAWVAACNSTGLTGKVEFGGSSAVITPWGDTTTAGSEEELMIASIDLDHVQQVRSENPFLLDYRDDILSSE